MLGIDRNPAPGIFDIFDDRNPSYNTVVLGQTGAGKTFGLLLLMMRHLLMGVRLIVIDPQGNIDLEFLGENVYQRSVLGTEQSSINVLDVIHDEIGMQIEMSVSMLRMLEVHQDEPLERALLDEALMSLYAPIWDTENQDAPTLAALQAWMNERAKKKRISPNTRECAERLSLALQVYVTGSRAALFGNKTTVDFALDKAVNVFDVSRLPQQGMGGNLRSALLSVLVANVNQGIRRRRLAGDRAPILFFVDEIGVLMRDAVIAEYISAEYKTSRARLVGRIGADQDLHSLLGPKD
ncbi:MAG: ATP-binding protein, partial [Anaerolineales bacterium]|nr:ATP-binding protein [Anaerolineales bacterium]